MVARLAACRVVAVRRRRRAAPTTGWCLHTAKGDFAFTVEIADTNETRAQGLMFRDHLAADAGMLFDYHQEQQASFWMQNTLIPLDMIFIGADGVVKTIHVNAQPMDPTVDPVGGPGAVRARGWRAGVRSKSGSSRATGWIIRGSSGSD